MNVSEQASQLSTDSEIMEKNLSKLVDRLVPYMKTALPRSESGTNIKTPIESATGRRLRQVDASISYVTLTLDMLLNSIDL